MMVKMRKSDIERLWELEVENVKATEQKSISKDDLFLTALDFNDEIIIIRSKIKDLSDTSIIIITNPDRADKDGAPLQFIDLLALKLVILTYKLHEEGILELLETEKETEMIEYIEN